MSDGDHHGNAGEHGGIRAKWIGPMRTLYAAEPDERGQRAAVGEQPVEYVQYRDDEGTVHHVPAGDLDDQQWDALPADARQAVRDSGLYDVRSDKEAAERRKESVKAQAKAPPPEAKES